MVQPGDDLIAVPRSKAASLAGVSERRLDYWAKTGVVGPAVQRPLGPRKTVRLYGWDELISVLVAVELRERGVSLQHIRQIVAYLREQAYTRPLAEVRFAVEGRNVYIQHPDGTWVDSRKPGQGVIAEVLPLEPLRARVRSASTLRRRDRGAGEIERRRGVLGGKPVIAGTRVPVETVRRYLRRGAAPAEVLRAFPMLVAEDVEAVRRELPAA